MFYWCSVVILSVMDNAVQQYLPTTDGAEFNTLTKNLDN